jgi:hypothetical protein
LNWSGINPMAWALSGAQLSILLLYRIHDRQISKLTAGFDHRSRTESRSKT